MATVWENALEKITIASVRLNRIKGVVTYLPSLPYSLYLLDRSVNRFLADVKPILVVRIDEALGRIQYLINFADLSPLTIIKLQ